MAPVGAGAQYSMRGVYQSRKTVVKHFFWGRPAWLLSPFIIHRTFNLDLVAFLNRGDWRRWKGKAASSRRTPKRAGGLWRGEGEFGILRRGEVQGCILRLGNGTGGHG